MSEKQKIKCISKAFIERDVVQGGFKWAVYNKLTGNIVSILYCEGMAKRLMFALNCDDSGFLDGYDYCEMWRE